MIRGVLSEGFSSWDFLSGYLYVGGFVDDRLISVGGYR